MADLEARCDCPDYRIGMDAALMKATRGAIVLIAHADLWANAEHLERVAARVEEAEERFEWQIPNW